MKKKQKSPQLVKDIFDDAYDLKGCKAGKCPNCGDIVVNGENANFCGKCGCAITWEEKGKTINKTEPPHKGTGTQSPQSLSFNIKIEETTQPIKILQELGFKEDEVKRYSDGTLVEHYATFEKVTEIGVRSDNRAKTIETQRIIFYDIGIYTVQCFVGNIPIALEINKELHDAISLEARKWL